MAPERVASLTSPLVMEDSGGDSVTVRRALPWEWLNANTTTLHLELGTPAATKHSTLPNQILMCGQHRNRDSSRYRRSAVRLQLHLDHIGARVPAFDSCLQLNSTGYMNINTFTSKFIPATI